MNQDRSDKPSDFEEQINALIDGELNDDQVAALLSLQARQPRLERDLARAQSLQQALSQIPTERAPHSLRHKLEQIGNSPAPGNNWWRWAAVAAAVPLLLLLMVPDQISGPSAEEIEQGRRDLALALAYLEKAQQQTVLEIGSSIDGAVVGSIRDNTLEVLKKRIDTNEEVTL